MILDRWADINSTWHIWADPGFLCNLQLVEFDQERLVQATVEDPYPPAPCMKCLHVQAMATAVDEPLDVAKGRGYYPPED